MGIRSQNNPEQSFNDVFANTGLEAASAAPIPLVVSGGTKTTYNGKTIHTFTATSPFALTSDTGPLAIEYVVIGGGASGGSSGTNAYGGGGGGAGQVRTGTTTIATGTWAVTIGAGGATAAAENTPGNNGANSSAAFPSGTITGYGGGGGASSGPHAVNAAGKNGVNYPSPTAGSGSGGGGGKGYQGVTYEGGPAALGAYPGGNTGPQPGGYMGSGGGGAGGAGGAGPTSPGNVTPSPVTEVGYGGLALQLPTTFRDPATAPTTGTPGPSGTHWVGGGGSAGLYSNPAPATVNSTNGGTGPGGGGPYGGGGNGGSGTGIDGSAAGANTGGGGGGGGAKVPEGGDGGAGGSGLVLIAYDS